VVSGFQAGIKNLDRVVAVNGAPVSSPGNSTISSPAGRSGLLLTYTLERGEKRSNLEVPVSLFTARDYFLCLPAAMVLGFLFCGGRARRFLLEARSAHRLVHHALLPCPRPLYGATANAA